MTRLLIVDDSEAIRRQVRESLEGLTEEVVEADSGASALAALGKHPGPWIILLDWHIPEPDGYSVCRLVRQRFTTTPPYIVLISSKASRADVANGDRKSVV